MTTTGTDPGTDLRPRCSACGHRPHFTDHCTAWFAQGDEVERCECPGPRVLKPKEAR